MSTPRCPKCDHTSFQMTEISPERSAFKLMAVHCSGCGTIVGTMDYYNIGTLLHKIAKKIGVSL